MSNKWSAGSKFLTLGVSAFLLASCKPPETSPATAGAKISTYEMRGVIVRLGTEAAPRLFTIHHEATKDMDSMTMRFPIDNNVALTGLAVGDKISFRYEVDQKTFEDHVTKLEKLPADTVLNLSVETTTSPAAGTMKGMPGM